MKKPKLKVTGMILLSMLFLVLSALVLSGCTGGPKVDSTLPAPTEKKLETLRIGVMSDVGAVPFIIARDQGFFEKRGLDVEIQVFKSAMDRDAALQTGNLDGAMADMLTVIFFNEAGVEVKMTSGTYGNYKLITSPKLDATSFSALESISVGISSNTVIDFATQKVAEAKGLDSKIKKTAIPQMPVRLEMLRAGELNGATLPDPLASAAALDGGTVIGSTEEFGLFPGVFIFTQDAIDQNPEGITLMYEAYNEAVEHLNSLKTETYFDLLVESLGFPPVLKGQFELPVFELAGPPDLDTFIETSAWMKGLALSKKVYEYEALTDTSVLPQ